MRSPMSILEPPPSIREIMKVEMAGTKTMVTPVEMPGTLRGKITLEKTWKGLAPRSWAASMTRSSILVMME